METDLPSAKPIRARRTHQKSRLGCSHCKKRRIKILRHMFCFSQLRYDDLPSETNSFQCDEKKPTCSNCSNHLIECAYNASPGSSGSQSPGISEPPTGRPRPSRYRPQRYATGGLRQTFKLSKSQPSQTTQSTGTQCDLSSGSIGTISIADLQLFHHYTIETYRTMTNDGDQYHIWQKYLVEWGIEFPSILHLILALSALHLAHEQPILRVQYLQQADDHFTFGIRSVTSVLSQLNAENCQKVYMSAILICFIYFGRGPRPKEYLIFSTSGPAEWLTLMHGVRLIVQTHRAKVFSGLLEPKSNEQSHDLTTEMRNELHEHTVHTEAVQRLVERDISNKEDRGKYLAAIENLLEIMRGVYERRSAGSSGVDLMDLLIGWVYRLSEEMVGSLERKEPYALVILAYWAVLLKYMDSAWFMSGWAEHVLSGISTCLDEEFCPWIEWPMKQVYQTQLE
ncbi:RTA-like protein [Penicillium atrosanguineum]|uniref:RTA-like protein n=1 Tax=Penicillium atrosanguineum TaxID=1132637 RepID=UPI0023959AA1|nr:RTA-like protein [Penicillium atrosanguineum]KAJ5310093.1 RTA-like protein [Penicillium atrosanguineum]